MQLSTERSAYQILIVYQIYGSMSNGSKVEKMPNATEGQNTVIY